MKRLGLALLAWAAFTVSAWAQTVTTWPPPAGTIVFLCVYNASPPSLTSGDPAFTQCDSTGHLLVNATVTASVTGFRPTNYGTPITATTSGATGTLPTNTGEVVATNVGTTNGAYCQLGASSSTSGQYIAPNGGWFGFAINSDTQLSCQGVGGTTTINMAGGSGLPTGTGGGSGGGSSGAVFGPTAVGTAAANPPVLTGGTADGTATGNVAVWKIVSGVGYLNIAQVNGVTTLAGAGAVGTGSQRVAVGQDTTTIAGSAPGTAGTPSANVVSIQGVVSGTVVPVNVNNANSNGRATSANSSPVVPSAAPTTWHLIAANSTNATSVKASAATLMACQLGGVGSTPAFLKIYNKASSPTVGTDTPVLTLIIPAASTAANGAGSNISFGPGGLALGTGFAAAITGVITDADTTAVAATTFSVSCQYE